MAALGEDVKFGGNFGIFQFEEIDGGVFDVHRVVLGLEDEGRRSVGSGVDFWVSSEVLFGKSEIARIEDDRKVRATGELVCGIDGVVEALVKMSGEGGGEVRSGGEAKDADAVGSVRPRVGVSADHAESTLGVLQGGGGIGERARVRHAIFNENAVHMDGD